MNTGISKEHSGMVKGLAAICIFWSHIGGFLGIVTGTKLDLAVAMFGYLFVGVFLFLSGYGIQKQFRLKGADYISSFPKRRILPLFIIECITVVLYLLFDLAHGKMPSVVRLIQSVLFGDTIVSNGWYLQVALLLYVLFFIACRIFGNTVRSRLCLVGLCILYIAVAFLCKLEATWYQTVPLFVLGVFWAECEDARPQLFRDWKVLVGSAVLFILLVSLRSINAVPFALQLLFTCLSALFWTVLVIGLVSFFNLSSRFCGVFGWLGTRSLEIYIFQGMAFRLFIPLSAAWYIKLLASIAVTLLIAIVMHLLFQGLKRKISTPVRSE